MQRMLCLVLIVLAEFASAARAQDFRVSTKVFDASQTQHREVTRSWTLFHAGRAYDFIDQVGELIVYEKSHDRFTLVNTRQRRATVVHVDEVKRMLQMARNTLSDHLDAAKQQEHGESKKTLEQMLFQLEPKFEESLEEKEGFHRLLLKSAHYRYEVDFTPAPTREHVETYLNYADWICRLNYVMHPGPIMPEQRLLLNARLRKSGKMPTRVTLVADTDQALKLTAEHSIYWDLNDKDRELLRQWDATLNAKDLKRVSLQEYQRALLVSQAKSR